MTEPDQHVLGWTPHEGDVWTRTLPSRVGDPNLLLRVCPSPLAISWGELWIWEVVDPYDDSHCAAGEIDNGEASSCAAAMEAALAEALAHVARLADE